MENVLPVRAQWPKQRLGSAPTLTLRRIVTGGVRLGKSLVTEFHATRVTFPKRIQTREGARGSVAGGAGADMTKM